MPLSADTIPKCNNCSVTSNSCKLCSRCRVVHYCNIKCQKEDFKVHKRKCKYLKGLRDEIQRLKPEDELFETDIGLFWEMDEPRRYCTMRFLYAQEMLQMGYEDDNMLPYETGLSHFLELHRLCQDDDLGVRYYVPFVLLVLKRLDDCYGYVKWWAEGYSWEETMEGEWMYLHYEDSMQDMSILGQTCRYYQDQG